MRYVTNAALAVLSVLAPTKPVLITAFVLVLADLLTGIFAARQRGESITSRGMRRSLTKLCVYEVMLTLAYVAGVYMIQGLPVFKIAASMVGLTELRSIFENLSVLTDASVIKLLIEKLGGPPEHK